MHLSERNAVRAKALAPIDDATRRKLALDRIVEVEGDTADRTTMTLDLRFTTHRDPAPDLIAPQDAMAALALPSLAGVDGLDLSRLELGSKGIGPIAKSPYLARVKRLAVRQNKLGSAGLKTLLSSPHVAALEWLDVAMNKIDAKGVPLLAENASLGRLAYLDVIGNELGNEGTLAIIKSAKLGALRTLVGVNADAATMSAIAEAPEIARLRELRVGGAVGVAGATALATSAHAGALETLGIGAAIDEGALAIAKSTSLAKLRSLSLAAWVSQAKRALAVEVAQALGASMSDLRDLRMDTFGDAEHRALVDAGVLARLRSLHVGSYYVAGDAFAPIFENAGSLESFTTSQVNALSATVLARAKLGAMRALSLAQCGLTADAVRALVENATIGALERLDLSSNEVGPDAATAIASSERMASVTHLKLDGAGIGVEGARAIASSAHLSKLRHLSLSLCSLGDDGVRAIADSKSLHLELLDLSNDGLSDDALAALASGPATRTLRELRIQDRVSGDSVRALLAALPDLRVIELPQHLFGECGELASDPTRIVWFGTLVRRWGD